MNHEITKNKYRLGMRVLVVDDSHTCRLIVKKQLKRMEYKVVSVSRASEALKLLHERKGGFDLVVADVHMPKMNGFELLDIIRRKFGVPVILMSSDDTKSSMIKGLRAGASFYLQKPLKERQIQDLWLVAYRNKMQGSQVRTDEVALRHDVKRKRAKESREEGEACPITTKKRLVWTTELHNQFVNALKKLGNERVVPKKICELMNTKGLSRVNVASHLQKFRASMEKHRISVPAVEPRAAWIGEPRTPWASFITRGECSQQNQGNQHEPRTPWGSFITRGECSQQNQGNQHEPHTPWGSFITRGECSQQNQGNQHGGASHVDNFTSIIPSMVNQNPPAMPMFAPSGSSHEQSPINIGPNYYPPTGNIGIATQPFPLEGMPAQSHCPTLDKREESLRGKGKTMDEEASQTMPPPSEEQQAEMNNFFDSLLRSNMDEIDNIRDNLDKYTSELESPGVSLDPEFDVSEFLNISKFLMDSSDIEDHVEQ